MKITFDEPAQLNHTLGQKRTIAAMEVITVAFNLRPHPRDGAANVSVTLECEETGHQEHFVFTDKTDVPALWREVKELQLGGGEKWLAQVLKRAIAEGRLPSGTISTSASAPDAASPNS